MYKLPPTTRKKVIFIICVCLGIPVTVWYYDNSKLLNYPVVLPLEVNKGELSFNSSYPEEEKLYLVSSSKCKIINLNPFSKDAKKYFKPLEYKTCTTKKLLTYVTQKENIATVHINNEIIPEYTIQPVTCCYSDVTRGSSEKDPDAFIKLTPCKKFQDNVTITLEAILIKCIEQRSKKNIYENVHTSVRITEDVQKKINNFENSTNRPLSVLFIGIDSISRLNFIRALPKTYKYVENNEWVPLKGYNKIDDNTFPNLMAILAGFNQTTAYTVCNPKAIGPLDHCPLLWYKYKDCGYVTGYGEDEASISTFNYNKKGFVRPPTDYYFRPYILATEKLNIVRLDSLSYCTGPETSGERILNLAKDFATTFVTYPHFGFFWMNTFSHNDISTASMMDNKLETLLTELDHRGITNNTLIVFLSDHGLRFGDIRATETGWLEERLPFIYFSFPTWFKEKFPKQYQNFQNNEYKLTTPYDLHMTLQHILVLSGFNYTMQPTDACPTCMSLFEEVPTERSCEDASIAQHWCTCVGYIGTSLEPLVAQRLSSFILTSIHKILRDKSRAGGYKCAKYDLDIINARFSHKLSYKNTSYVLVNLKTIPKAIFEATVSFEGDILNSALVLGDISRLDSYASNSECVSDEYLKRYCYCRYNILSIINNFVHSFG